MMLDARIIIILVLATASSITAKTLRNNGTVRKFPDEFLFGAGTAAYQVEGGWDADGKAENIWDRLTHTHPCITLDCNNGDIASDSYHNADRDLEMMRQLGVQFQRFSISWTRLLPTGFPDKINQAGLDYYNKLIDGMLEHNIQPMINLYHMDLPQKLQDLGGWANPYVIEWFSDYARVAYELFGDRVKYWITINEPRELCILGYGAGISAPLLKISGFAEYLCIKNVLIAHATAWHIYDKEFRPTQGGVNGIAFAINWHVPLSDTEDDIEAASDYNTFQWDFHVHPIFSEEGNYPQKVIDRIAAKSAEQGYHKSRLPAFTEAEIEFVKGTADFIGINHYTTHMVYRNETSAETYNEEPSYYNDMNGVTYRPAEWLKGVPWGLYKILMHLKDKYNPVIYIIENGLLTYGGLDDDDRVNYYRTYLDTVLDALDDGADVRGYMAWSLMDNFEWIGGFLERYGLFEVDFESPERTRTPRRSAFAYKEIIRSRTIDYTYEPDTTVMTIDPGH